MNTEFDHSGKISASQTPALKECSSRLATSLDADQFCDENKIPRLGKLMEEVRGSKDGTDLHAVLSGFPVHLPQFGFGQKYDLDAKIEEVISKMGVELTKQDLGFVRRAVRMRNKLINEALADIPAGVKQIHVSLDDNRMYDYFFENRNGVNHERSGLGDVVVTATDRKGAHHAVILDYKTGRYTDNTTGENSQLDALVVHKKIDTITLKSAYAAILNRDSVWEAEPTMAYYGEQEIKQAWRSYDNISDRATVILDARKQGDTEHYQDLLFQNAKVGDACKYCDGKLCCMKFRLEMQSFPQFAEAATDAINQKIAKGDDMNLDDVAYVIALGKMVSERAKLFEKAAEEGKAITHELNSTHKVAVEGVNIGNASERFAIMKNELGVKPDAEDIAAILSEAFPGKVKKKDVMGVAKVDAGDIRSLVSGIFDIPESKVHGFLSEKLGENNPFGMTSVKGRITVSKEYIAQNLSEFVNFRPAVEAKPKARISKAKVA